jgi:AcrR family transcriptional regulator
MRARAEAAEQTRQRILRAAGDLFWEKLTLEITLDDVAERAGVSVQTVLRQFGSRDGLFDAAEAFGREQVLMERAAPAGDVEAAIRAIFDHYERIGDAVLRMLGQEHWVERIKRITDRGRHTHREWVEQVFGPQLDARPARDREALTDLLVVATDVYTWKLLRRDRGLERPQAEGRVRHMIAALLAAIREER